MRKEVRRASGSTSVDRQVGTGDRQHQAGQAGSGADVEHRRALRDPLAPPPRS